MSGAMLLGRPPGGVALAGQQPAPQAVPRRRPIPPSGGRRKSPSRRPSRIPSRAGACARASTLVPIDNGVDPLLYRLWGLQPLQSQLIKRGELVLEVWARPATGVRQAVIRVTVRRDGRAFVQARAGLGCCTPEIGRRVDIDAELAPQQIPR
jgi:hypothetical protein